MKKGDKFGTGDPEDPMASGDFMAEDVYACEQQQRSMYSPMYSVGATAKTMEKSVVDFQSVVLSYMDVDVEGAQP